MTLFGVQALFGKLQTPKTSRQAMVMVAASLEAFQVKLGFFSMGVGAESEEWIKKTRRVGSVYCRFTPLKSNRTIAGKSPNFQ